MDEVAWDEQSNMPPPIQQTKNNSNQFFENGLIGLFWLLTGIAAPSGVWVAAANQQSAAVEGDEESGGCAVFGVGYARCQRHGSAERRQATTNTTLNSSSTKQKRESVVDFFSSLNWLSNGIGAANEMNQSMEKKESNKRRPKQLTLRGKWNQSNQWSRVHGASGIDGLIDLGCFFSSIKWVMSRRLLSRLHIPLQQFFNCLRSSSVGQFSLLVLRTSSPSFH